MAWSAHRRPGSSIVPLSVTQDRLRVQAFLRGARGSRPPWGHCLGEQSVQVARTATSGFLHNAKFCLRHAVLFRFRVSRRYVPYPEPGGALCPSRSSRRFAGRPGPTDLTATRRSRRRGPTCHQSARRAHARVAVPRPRVAVPRVPAAWGGVLAAPTVREALARAPAAVAGWMVLLRVRAGSGVLIRVRAGSRVLIRVRAGSRVLIRVRAGSRVLIRAAARVPASALPARALTAPLITSAPPVKLTPEVPLVPPFPPVRKASPVPATAPPVRAGAPIPVSAKLCPRGPSGTGPRRTATRTCRSPRHASRACWAVAPCGPRRAGGGGGSSWAA